MAGEVLNPTIDVVRVLNGVGSNTTTIVPAGYVITAIYVVNTTANTVTGGVKIGTTDGGVDVVAALAVVGNALVPVQDAALLKRLFSTTVDTTLYIQPVVAWASASLNIRLVLRKLF